MVKERQKSFKGLSERSEYLRREYQYNFIASVKRPLRRSGNHECNMEARKNRNPLIEGDGDAADCHWLLIRQSFCSTLIFLVSWSSLFRQ